METKTNESQQINRHNGLTPQQEQVAMLLASGQSITDVAKQMGLNRCTLYEWQKTPPFLCFYNKCKQDYQEDLNNGIFAQTKKALEVINNSLNSENELTRIKVAMWLIERVASVEIKNTDLRNYLKEKNTGNGWHLDDYKLNENNYKTDCQKYGIEP